MFGIKVVYKVTHIQVLPMEVRKRRENSLCSGLPHM